MFGFIKTKKGKEEFIYTDEFLAAFSDDEILDVEEKFSSGKMSVKEVEDYFATKAFEKKEKEGKNTGKIRR